MGGLQITVLMSAFECPSDTVTRPPGSLSLPTAGLHTRWPLTENSFQKPTVAIMYETAVEEENMSARKSVNR